jgi:hypothetical protein
VLPCNIDCGQSFAGCGSVEDSERASLAYYFTMSAKNERKLGYAKCESRTEKSKNFMRAVSRRRRPYCQTLNDT